MKKYIEKANIANCIKLMYYDPYFIVKNMHNNVSETPRLLASNEHTLFEDILKFNIWIALIDDYIEILPDNIINNAANAIKNIGIDIGNNNFNINNINKYNYPNEYMGGLNDWVNICYKMKQHCLEFNNNLTWYSLFIYYNYQYILYCSKEITLLQQINEPCNQNIYVKYRAQTGAVLPSLMMFGVMMNLNLVNNNNNKINHNNNDNLFYQHVKLINKKYFTYCAVLSLVYNDIVFYKKDEYEATEALKNIQEQSKIQEVSDLNKFGASMLYKRYLYMIKSANLELYDGIINYINDYNNKNQNNINSDLYVFQRLCEFAGYGANYWQFNTLRYLEHC